MDVLFDDDLSAIQVGGQVPLLVLQIGILPASVVPFALAIDKEVLDLQFVVALHVVIDIQRESSSFQAGIFSNGFFVNNLLEMVGISIEFERLLVLLDLLEVALAHDLAGLGRRRQHGS